MPRRRVVAAREILPDPKFGSQTLAKFINRVMEMGKKSVAESIVYGALARVQEKGKNDPVDFFETTLDKLRPMVEVKARRVGGATYQVPMEVPARRQIALAMRWIVGYASKRKGATMTLALANELRDAATGQGQAIKKRDDTHKMAQANRAFAHFRF